MQEARLTFEPVALSSLLAFPLFVCRALDRRAVMGKGTKVVFRFFRFPFMWAALDRVNDHRPKLDEKS